MALTPEEAAPEDGSEYAGVGRLMAETGRFLFAVEMETTRGLLTDGRAREATERAREVADSGQIDFISISDNPFGNPSISPEVMGEDLLERGQEVVINLCCKDRNRNAIESRLWAYGEEERMLARPAVLQNSALRRTSAWANAFLGRDSRAAQAEGSKPG